MKSILSALSWLSIVLVTPSVLLAQGLGVPCSVADYPSIQAAVDDNPGRPIYIPAGDYLLSESVTVSTDGTELFGHGRLIQQNPNAAVVRFLDADHVTIRGVTLTRSEDKEEATSEALRFNNASFVRIDEVQIINNRAKDGAITVTASSHVTIRDCLVQNYSRITVDDRTQANDGKKYGYAFNCIDGTGISISKCSDVLIEGNRVIEQFLRATPEMKQQYQLGTFVKQNELAGTLVSKQTWESKYVNNWHQGSAIIVSSPAETQHVRLLNNHIENAAQGIDIHADHVTVQGNVVVNAFIGMKAMHGSRYTLITGNQFSKSVLWAIGLMPGAASEPGNEDGDSIIANNIISEFGYGDAAWIWPHEEHACFPIRLDRGQEPDDPPLKNVIITGNIISETRGNSASPVPPRYKMPILLEQGANGPQEIIITNNHF